MKARKKIHISASNSRIIEDSSNEKNTGQKITNVSHLLPPLNLNKIESPH